MEVQRDPWEHGMRMTDLLIHFEEWGRFTRGWSATTAYNYVLRCRKADTWMSASRGRGICAATRTDVEAWLLRTCRSPAARNGSLQAVRAFYRWGMRHGLVATDPTSDVQRLRPKQAVPASLSAEQARRVWAAAADCRRTRALVAVLLHAGLRREEVRCLQWDDVQDGWLRFTAKGGMQRCLPLHPAVVEALAAWHEQCPRSPWVWPSPTVPGQPVSTTTLHKWVQQVGERAGVHLHCHRARHTMATQMVERGVDIRAVQCVLGHQSLKTTARYLTVRDPVLVDAVAALDYT